ncbi:MAG TPA: ABC transporter permease [Fimbriimonas sp.]|nr:ABC transporter permease [Fimbriimonas sp.]
MKQILRNPLLLVGLGYLFVLVLFAVLGPSIRTAQLRQPGDLNFSATTTAVGPVYAAPGTPKLPLGTDEIGRDEVARLAAGAQVSLMVGFVVQVLAVSTGMLMGVLGTFTPPWIRMPVLRFTDAMFAFPDILLAILIVGTFSAPDLGVFPVIVALGITAWPSVTRLTVTQIASVKDREYVVAARAAGASLPYLVRKHILPQVFPLILAVSMVEMAGTVLAESTLSFIGIGVQAPKPSWGNMINDVRSGEITSHVPQLVFPCLLLSLTIFALNFVGDGLLAALDPKKG